MIRKVYARLKENPVNPYLDDDEDPSISYFLPDKPIQIFGKLYDRGIHDGDRYPDLYLARKAVRPSGNDIESYAALTDRRTVGKYQSYDGNDLGYQARNEKDYMWLQNTEIDIYIPPAILAKSQLQKWDD